jgi:hypothetical protein
MINLIPIALGQCEEGGGGRYSEQYGEQAFYDLPVSSDLGRRAEQGHIGCRERNIKINHSLRPVGSTQRVTDKSEIRSTKLEANKNEPQSTQERREKIKNKMQDSSRYDPIVSRSDPHH